MNSFFSLLKTGSFGLSARMEIFFSKTAWNLIRQTYPKVDYAGIVRKKLNIPNPSHSIIAWMALNSGLQQIELADFIPTNTVTLCGLCMLEDESAEHLFSAAMQGGFFLSSVRNVDMISLQPTFMMFANGL
uniref:ORF130 protein n=1 Tax=Turritis glabra TaxID=63678 RepID=A0A5H2UXU3_TURGL|nr:ORF130 protein [Turritis glabra]